MVITPDGIRDAVGREVPLIFGDAADALGAGAGEYIRDGMPESIPGKIGQAVARSMCRIYGSGAALASPLASVLYEKSCRPYLDDLNPGGGPGIGKPYEGGQCPVSYLVYATSQGTDLSIGGQTPLNILGPLGTPSFTATVVGFPFPDSTRYAWEFPNDPGKFLQFVGRAEFDPQPGFRVDGRTDGLPDNCGNPPPVVRGPRPDPDGNPPPFEFFPDADIDIDIGVDFNIDGSVDIDIGTGPINIRPFGGRLPGGDDGGGGGGPAPGDIGSPGGAGTASPGDDAEGQAPDGSVLVGLKIAVNAFPENAKTYGPGRFRGACYIYMGVPGNLDQDFGGSILTDNQFFFAEKDNLTNWRVAANTGYNLEVTPFYREVEES